MGEPDRARPAVHGAFGEISRIEARGREVRVTLKSGTAFDLDRLDASDFDDGRQPPEYVPWAEVQQVDFDRPPAMYPPLGGH